jgi:branched-chain amino acid transport system ATP-binding protein
MGSVTFKGEQMLGKKAYQIAHKGLGYVPENRDIFPALTVEQNLLLGMKRAKPDKGARWALADMYRLFPRLQERAKVEAGMISGGEQQMLTLCRTLMGDPDLIMIDEPTEGLAPKIVELLAELFNEIKNRGVSILLVEQKLAITLDISERLYVLGHGAIVFEGTAGDVRTNAAMRKEWLEV